MKNFTLTMENEKWVMETTEKIINKIEWVSEKSKYKIPSTTNEDGTHDDKSGIDLVHMDNGLNWWTNGLWAGILWQMYKETNDIKYAEIAGITENKMDTCFDLYSGLHHDVGFMWMPLAVADYRLTGNMESRKRALHAASLLAGRFNPVGEFIRAWNDLPDPTTDTRGWAIIDCMINISLLYWASDETGDPRFKQIAIKHADTTIKYFIRPDGSTNHIVEFNPEDGRMVKSYGGQGYAEGSSWSRGQAWALYGFIISYIHTDKIEYLDTAKKVAHYFIANIPESGIIPVDFRQPKEPAWEDCCAASIAACGLIEIARNVGELECDIYLNAAIKMLRAIDSARASWGKENDCIVLNCSGSYHSNVHHIPMVYADEFYIEAILKLKGNEYFIW